MQSRLLSEIGHTSINIGLIAKNKALWENKFYGVFSFYKIFNLMLVHQPGRAAEGENLQQTPHPGVQPNTGLNQDGPVMKSGVWFLAD